MASSFICRGQKIIAVFRFPAAGQVFEITPCPAVENIYLFQEFFVSYRFTASKILVLAHSKFLITLLRSQK